MFSLKKWFLALTVVFFSGAAIAELSPDEVVKKTADDVISSIKSDKDIQAGNKKAIYELVESKILPSFDFNKICRLVMGKNWRKMSAEQKEEFSLGFKMLLLRTYAVALSKYTDQKITVLPMKKQKGSIVTVKTEITQASSQPINVDYALSNSTGKWLVIDLIIEGVSMITNYRGQFGTSVRTNGIDGLLKELKNKNNAA
jgi:phospholipid transport system substrate-binding protein